jgi:hypothetical protein
MPRAAKLADRSMAMSFCFFADGVDEYTSNNLELIHLLNVLKQHSVKIYASSQLWMTFRIAFEDCVPTTRVEDFSLRETRTYTSDKSLSIV